MKILSHPAVLIFLTIWLIEFYLMGMQRASLIVSRLNNVEWKGIGQQLLPNWYSLTWISRIAKYLLIIFILFNIGYKEAIVLLLSSFILSVLIPIPYRFFYKKIFRNKIKKIMLINKQTADKLSEMLDNANFECIILSTK